MGGMMKDWNKGMTLVMALAAMAIAGSARAEVSDRGQFPIPLKDTNRHAELAEDEVYTLYGHIIRTGNAYYFRVDLKAHTWLATEKRVANPHYPLSGPNRFFISWEAYAGNRVLMQARAKSSIVNVNGKPEHMIWLQVLGAPRIK